MTELDLPLVATEPNGHGAACLNVVGEASAGLQTDIMSVRKVADGTLCELTLRLLLQNPLLPIHLPKMRHSY